MFVAEVHDINVVPGLRDRIGPKQWDLVKSDNASTVVCVLRFESVKK